MEQNGYRDIPAKITKKFTKVVPAAVSTATTNLSSLTLEHNFKDVFKKARKQLWQKSSDHSEDCEESKRVAEVDNLIVFDDDKSTRQSPLERGSAVRASECSSVRNKTKSNANVKGQQPVHLSAKPHSKWHVRPPLPDIIDEPIKPVSSTTCSQPITPKAFQVTMDSSKTHPAPANRHLRNKATPVLLPGDATRPVPLPRNSSRPSSVVNQVTPQTSDPSPLHRLSRPQSHSDFAPVPLPRKKFPSKPCNDGAASSADQDRPSYSSLFDAAVAVENPATDSCRETQRPASTCSSLTDSTTDECAICFASPRDHAAIPCGHIYCEECAQQQLKTKGACYICKRDIIMVTKVYIN